MKLSIETAQQERKNAQTELAAVEAKINTQAKGNTKPNEDLLRQEAELRKQIQEWVDDIQRNELLVGYLNSRLGETITSEEKIKKIQEDINDLQSKAEIGRASCRERV